MRHFVWFPVAHNVTEIQVREVFSIWRRQRGLRRKPVFPASSSRVFLEGSTVSMWLFSKMDDAPAKSTKRSLTEYMRRAFR